MITWDGYVRTHTDLEALHLVVVLKQYLSLGRHTRKQPELYGVLPV